MHLEIYFVTSFLGSRVHFSKGIASCWRWGAFTENVAECYLRKTGRKSSLHFKTFLKFLRLSDSVINSYGINLYILSNLQKLENFLLIIKTAFSSFFPFSTYSFPISILLSLLPFSFAGKCTITVQISNVYVRFQVLTASIMKMTAFRVTAPYSLVEVDRRFRGMYCFHHQGDE
jgi:hypothetical protein